jgi:hypothetical protein
VQLQNQRESASAIAALNRAGAGRADVGVGHPGIKVVQHVASLTAEFDEPLFTGESLPDV